MKKSMMIAAALLVAGVTQAATVNWSWSAGVFMDQDWNNINNGMVSLYFTGDLPGGSPFSSGAIVDGSASGSYSADHLALNNQGVTYRFTTQIAGVDHYVDTTFTILGLVGGGNPSDGEALGGWMNGALNALLTTYGDGSTFKVDYGSSAAAQGAGWTPVPEPTSFALLALGAAAVGLRRRICKA